MSSYHSSFTYLNQNSAIDHQLIIASFEPDSGTVDTFLSMEAISEDSYDGTKKFDYGARYNSVAEINITFIKPDGSDFSVADNRRLLKWLTGSRTNSWLDLYEGNVVKYSFFGRITNVQQQKVDARVIGIVATFTSIHPWAWSAQQKFTCDIGENTININGDGVIYKYSEENSLLGLDNGVLFNDDKTLSAMFNIDHYGVIYNDDDVSIVIDNQSDDLYTYIYLDMVYTNVDGNETGNTVTIKNVTLQEDTMIANIDRNEIVSLNSGQFIISNKPNKIFGDAFNFVWPRLSPGVNNFKINGSGRASIEFTFRYPIKVGDCAVDINNIINNPVCCDYISGGGNLGMNVENVILFTEQKLTDTQKEQARENIGAISADDIPVAIRNPYSIRFTGAVEATYNGSKLVQVNIPENNKDAVLFTEQELTDDEKAQVRANIGAISTYEVSESMGKVVLYDQQSLNDSEKQQVRTNIGAVSENDIPTNLPNPSSLTFTGAVNTTYDGSNAITVNIPDAPGVASSNRLGMVKIGDGLAIDSDTGVLNTTFNKSAMPSFEASDEGSFIVVDSEGNMISSRDYLASIEADSIASSEANSVALTAVENAASSAASSAADISAKSAAESAANTAVENAANNFWTGKKSIWFGTSITDYCRRTVPTYGYDFTDCGYPQIVVEELSMANLSISTTDSSSDICGDAGAAIAYSTNDATYGSIYKTVYGQRDRFSNYDLICIEGCTNDFKLNVDIGLWSNTNTLESFNTNTFYGALQYSIISITSKNPDAIIMLISDTKRAADSNGEYAYNYTNDAGYVLKDYVDAMSDVAERYGVIFCDWFTNSGITTSNINTYTWDNNLHLNEAGYAKVGALTADTLSDYAYDYAREHEYENAYNSEYNTVYNEEYDIAYAEKYPIAYAEKYEVEYNNAYNNAYASAYDIAYDSVNAPTYIDVKNKIDDLETDISSVSESIPTATSQLTNDSEFVTATYVSGMEDRLSAIEERLNEIVALIETINAKYS